MYRKKNRDVLMIIAFQRYSIYKSSWTSKDECPKSLYDYLLLCHSTSMNFIKQGTNIMVECS